ncbi:MAG: hypothetical protein KAG95_03600, partial [Bacteroidales bacterium]|nr:hypothetical protein [Bacteroidales bacterium]
MKTKIYLFSAILLFGIFSFSSCKKDEIDSDTTSSEDNSLAENMFEDVFKVVDETLKSNDLDGTKSYIYHHNYGDCGVVTIEPAGRGVFPKTITIDFGDTNCVGDNGVSRRGKIITIITDYYRNAGSVRTTTFDNFYINDYKIEGIKTVTNQGRNEADHMYYTIEVSNGSITSPEGEEITWQSNRTREWIEGEETTVLTDGLAGILDDVYLITGSSSGVNRFGKSYTITITKALRVAADCFWISEGAIEIAPEDKKIRTLDYGDGTCD